jgi:protein SCO1/2
MPQGVVIDPPRPMPDFTLTDTHGKPVHLSDLRGKAILMFFGYTHCPDICPFSLSTFMKVKQGLGNDAAKVNFVMISVDGSRDTPDVMAAYMRAFDPEFIGLTGPDDDVRQIGVNYGVHFEKQQATNTSGSYIVAHTTYTYLLDADGRWRMVFPLRTPIDAEVADIQAVLREMK